MSKQWLIITWRHQDYMDGQYGQCLEEFEGTEEAAREYAKSWVAQYSPIGIVEVIG